MTIAVASHRLSVYDARSLALVRSIPLRPTPALPTAAAISPDGLTIVIGSRSGSVSFVDVSTGDARREFGGQGAAVAGLVYSPDGRTVVSVGDDNKMIVWDPKTATSVAVLAGLTEIIQADVVHHR